MMTKLYLPFHMNHKSGEICRNSHKFVATTLSQYLSEYTPEFEREEEDDSAPSN